MKDFLKIMKNALCVVLYISHEEIKHDGNGETDMPTIVHFDIPSDNIERSKKFYSDLFGWKMDKWSGSSEAMEYWLISTADDKGNKAIGGGMGKRQSPQHQGITNFFDLSMLSEGMSKCTIVGISLSPFPSRLISTWLVYK